MTTLDFAACQTAFAISANAMKHAGRPDLADFYREKWERITPEISGLIRENARPAAGVGGGGRLGEASLPGDEIGRL